MSVLWAPGNRWSGVQCSTVSMSCRSAVATLTVLPSEAVRLEQRAVGEEMYVHLSYTLYTRA